MSDSDEIERTSELDSGDIEMTSESENGEESTIYFGSFEGILKLQFFNGRGCVTFIYDMILYYIDTHW